MSSSLSMTEAVSGSLSRRIIVVFAMIVVAAMSTLLALSVPTAPPVEWRIAKATLRTEYDGDGRASNSATIEPSANESTVALPDSWMTTRPSFRGSARYDLSVTGTPQTVSLALYIPRINNYCRIEINGRAIFADGSAGGERVMMWTRPIFIDIPTELLHAGSNGVEILVFGSGRSRAGLSEVYFGPKSALIGPYHARELLQVGAPRVGSMLTIALALPLLLIFIRDAAGSANYGFFAIAAITFGVHNLMPQVTLIPIAPDYWEPLVCMIFGAALTAFCIFLLRDVGYSSPIRDYIWLTVYGIGSLAIFFLPRETFYTVIGLMWYLPFFLLGLGCMALYIVHTLAEPTPRRVLLALGLLTLPGPAFNDFLWSIDAIPFATVLWLPLVFPTMLIMTSILLADDVARVRAALGSMNRVLEERVESARAELARSYEQSRETEREAISAQERLRLVRDMHDGVGTRLTLLLSGLQKGVVSSPEIQQGVEEALEEMRLLIDAQSPNTATVVEAAANLRYRLEPRLAAAGVATVWQVQPAAEMITLPANATLHVLRIILECVSNAVRHGRARNVTLAFALQAEDFDGRRRDALVVSVGDDGAGIVCASPGTRGSGRGLANARARAAAVGGRFEIESCPGGTRACLVVPL